MPNLNILWKMGPFLHYLHYYVIYAIDTVWCVYPFSILLPDVVNCTTQKLGKTCCSVSGIVIGVIFCLSLELEILTLILCVMFLQSWRCNFVFFLTNINPDRKQTSLKLCFSVIIQIISCCMLWVQYYLQLTN